MINRFEYDARHRKARKLADTARQIYGGSSIAASALATADDAVWHGLSIAAQTRPPSEETKHLVIKMLRVSYWAAS